MMAPPAPRLRPVRQFGGAYLHASVLRRLSIFLAVSLALVWAAVAAERSNLRRNAEQESSRVVSNMALAFAEEVGTTIRTVDVALLSLRRQWDGNRDEFAGVVRELNRELTSKVSFQVVVTDAGGNVRFASAGLAGRSVNLGDRDHVTALLRDPADRLIISRPLTGRMTGMTGVQFARPLYGPGGKPGGVILASVAPEYLSRFYDHVDLGKDTSVTLVHGRVVLARNAGAGGRLHVGAELAGPPFDTASKELAGVYRRVSRLDGIERIFGWKRLPQYDMVVSVGQSLREVNSRYASQQRHAVAAGVAISSIMLALGWWAIAANHNRSKALRALSSAEARWKLALDATGAGVWDWDLRSGQVVLTPQAQAVLGIDTATANWGAGSVDGPVHPDDAAQVMAALADMLAGRSADFRVEHRIVRRSGEVAWVLGRAQVVERDDQGAAVRVVGTVVDIDARKSQEEQVRHQAWHDALTGLANRVLFGDRLEQALLLARRAQTQLAVIYFDLDKFKPVNDTYGHDVGDHLLVEVARRVQGGLRQSDTLARLGGDEFAALLPDCRSTEDAMTVAQNILELLNQPFVVDGHALDISGSIGVSLYPDRGADAASLVHNADLAMYRSKQEGRNRVTLATADGA